MKLVNRNAAAQATGLSAWELRKGALEGKYPHVRVGNRFFFDVDTLTNVLRSQMENSLREQTAAL